jgi:3-hydroxyisobutyrate dehydrogenase-like beta-hydroxyacid dehydrogenase
MAQDGDHVAFLGIGTMGHAMATRALGAGIPRSSGTVIRAQRGIWQISVQQ